MRGLGAHREDKVGAVGVEVVVIAITIAEQGASGTGEGEDEYGGGASGFFGGEEKGRYEPMGNWERVGGLFENDQVGRAKLEGMGNWRTDENESRTARMGMEPSGMAQ